MSVLRPLASWPPLADQVPSPLGMRLDFTPIQGPLSSKAIRKLFFWPATQSDCSPHIIVLDVPSVASAKRRGKLPVNRPPAEQWPPFWPLWSVVWCRLLPAIMAYDGTIRLASTTMRNFVIIDEGQR